MSRQIGLRYEYNWGAKKVTPIEWVRLVAVNNDIARILDAPGPKLRLVDEGFMKNRIKIKTGKSTSSGDLTGQTLSLRGISYTIEKDNRDNTWIVSRKSSGKWERYFLDFRSSEPHLTLISDIGKILEVDGRQETVLKTYEKYALCVDNSWAIPLYSLRDLSGLSRDDLPKGYSEMEVFPHKQGYFVKCGNFYAGNSSMYRELYRVSKSGNCKKVCFFGKEDNENQDISLYGTWSELFAKVYSSRRADPCDKTLPRVFCEAVFSLMNSGDTSRCEVSPTYCIPLAA